MWNCAFLAQRISLGKSYSATVVVSGITWDGIYTLTGFAEYIGYLAVGSVPTSFPASIVISLGKAPDSSIWHSGFPYL